MEGEAWEIAVGLEMPTCAVPRPGLVKVPSAAPEENGPQGQADLGP